MKAKLIDGLIAFTFGIVGTALLLAISVAYVVAIHPSTWQ